MQKPQDFYDLTYAFIEICRDNNVRHVEIMFGPMAHLERGISFAGQFEAMERARVDAGRDFGVSVLWIMCIDREHTLEEALELLELAEPYRDAIVGLGLASYEKDNPPNKFLAAYQLAKERGYRLTAHCDCDQDNSTEHIRQCLDELGVERIDHGLHVLDDPALTEQVLADDGIALTMCATWRPRDPEPRRMEADQTDARPRDQREPEHRRPLRVRKPSHDTHDDRGARPVDDDDRRHGCSHAECVRRGVDQ